MTKIGIGFSSGTSKIASANRDIVRKASPANFQTWFSRRVADTSVTTRDHVTDQLLDALHEMNHPTVESISQSANLPHMMDWVKAQHKERQLFFELLYSCLYAR